MQLGDARFPPDFLIELSNQDVASLRSQNATLMTGRGAHRKYPPLAFTEHGARHTNIVVRTKAIIPP